MSFHVDKGTKAHVLRSVVFQFIGCKLWEVEVKDFCKNKKN